MLSCVVLLCCVVMALTSTVGIETTSDKIDFLQSLSSERHINKQQLPNHGGQCDAAHACGSWSGWRGACCSGLPASCLTDAVPQTRACSGASVVDVLLAAVRECNAARARVVEGVMVAAVSCCWPMHAAVPFCESSSTQWCWAPVLWVVCCLL
jgi:hypothetical protein